MPRRTTTTALLLTLVATCLTVVTAPAPAQAATIYGIRNEKSKLYLQPDDDFANGTNVVQQPRQAGGWQEWVFVTDGGYRSIQSNLGLVNMGIDRGHTQPYAYAIVANRSAAYNQDWKIIQHSNLYEIRNRNSGLCLGIDGASTAPGARAFQAPCDASANQRWQIVPW
jgi:hypothetical protein